MEPRTITQAEAADLLASSYETGRYEPLGLFLVGEDRRLARRLPRPGLPGRQAI